MRGFRGAALFCISAAACAQTLTNAALSGRYYFRHLQMTAAADASVSEARSALGTLTFDGAGRFTFSGLQNTGTSLSGNGVYTVSPGGFVTLTNPLRTDATVNARYSAGAVTGSTTEGAGAAYDLFVAIPAPTTPTNLTIMNGTWWFGTLESPLRGAFFRLDAADGRFADANVRGHSAARGHGIVTLPVSGGTYAMGAEGAGTITFSANDLIGGSRTLYVSRDGNLALAGSPSGNDLWIGVKSGASGFQNFYWAAGLRAEPGAVSSFAGALNALPAGRFVWSRRLRATGLSPAIDFTGVNSYALGFDGSGFANERLVQIAAGGGQGSAVIGVALSEADPRAYELYFGARMPSLTGTGTFLNPLGVLNGASFAPPGAPIAPGSFVTLFGSNLANATATAAGVPAPTTLGGVTVRINNVPAPLYFVSPGSINAIVPYAATGRTATIQVGSSNTVEVPLAPTAPGVFAANATGIGSGAITKADFSLVSNNNPARPGDIVIVFLTGLGAVTPSLPDGAPGGANPLNVAATPTVRIAGRPAEVLFSGLSGYPGLYQLNVRIPIGTPPGVLPLAVQTPDAYHDQVDLVVGN